MIDNIRLNFGEEDLFLFGCVIYYNLNDVFYFYNNFYIDVEIEV